MSKLSQSIVDTLKKDHIEPRPKWQFVLGYVCLWITIGSVVVMCSFASGLIFRDMFGTDWGMLTYITGSWMRGALLIVPYVWIVLMALTLYVSSKLFQSTKQGYRVRPILVTVAAIGFSLVCGYGLYARGTAERFEEQLEKRIPQMEKLHTNTQQIFVAPDKGVIAGSITAVSEQGTFTITDLSGKAWRVEVIEGQKKPRVDDRLLIRGEKIGEGAFRAKIVRPWKLPMRMRQELRIERRELGGEALQPRPEAGPGPGPRSGPGPRQNPPR